MRKTLKRMTSSLLDMVFPPRCAVCDGLLGWEDLAAGDGVHSACREMLIPVEEPVCMHCGRPLDREEREYCHDCARLIKGAKGPYGRSEPPFWTAQGKSLFVYQGQMKQMMYRFKYANRREYAGFLAKTACSKYGDWMRRQNLQAVVPVPMYRAKERRRGYNQAALFAREIASIMGVAYAPELVVRIRDTAPQKNLDDQERKNNLKKAFQTGNVVVKYKRILLVDDIYTTGSTAEAVAKELCRAGVEKIYFLSACIGKGL